MNHYLDPRHSPRALRLSVQEAKLRLLELGLEGEAKEKQLRARLSLWGVLAAALAGATTIFAASGGGSGGSGKGDRKSSVVGRAVKTGGRLAAKAGAIALPLVMRKLMSRFER